ncbi:MAG: sulfite exporter TauE/SafE family protein, partial [Acidimicrobiales bacterium]
PTVLAFGDPAVLANVSNTVGLVPGSVSGVVAYRRELSGQGRRLLVLASASVFGGLTGAVLLLALPHSVFAHVVPVLILMACLLVLVQPALARRMEIAERRPPHGGLRLYSSVFAAAVYGGYFGAAQGVILMGLLGVFLADGLQRLNAAKNVLALLVNVTSALFFIVATHVAWGPAGLLAVGAVVGGQLGGVLGRRLPPSVLRGVIIAVGVTAAAVLLA